jgi:ABC-type multidrug transport system ATPase subunit
MRLRIEQLSKRYRNGVQALDGITIDLDPGLFGLLGPNGAGKSTLLRILATLQEPDTGSLWLGDLNIREHPRRLRQQLGYLPQDFGVYLGWSARRLLLYLARLKGLRYPANRVQEVLEWTHLLEHQYRAVSQYSGGMRQRFGIAQLLLNDPYLLIVDEPTAGLDPGERTHFLQLLRDLPGERITILSTHLVGDVADLCSDLAILANGQIQLRQPPEVALAELKGQVWELEVHHHEKAKWMEEYTCIRSEPRLNNQISLRLVGNQQPDPSAILQKTNLEDVYARTIHTYQKQSR